MPDEFRLYQNYPNPFNPVTNIEFGLPKSGNVKLEIFDILGRKVSTILDKDLSSGIHKIQFDGRQLSCGVYFYKITAGKNFADVKTCETREDWLIFLIINPRL